MAKYLSFIFLRSKTMPSMFNPKFSLLHLAEVLCIFLCAGYSDQKKCVDTDKQALLRLKHGLVDERGIFSSWKREVDCCQWKGISCNNLTGRVTELVLPYTDTLMLGGNIDPSLLCELQHLTHLDLSFIDFEGNKIPKCIGSLVQLRELSLSANGLVGSIPHELRNLSNLQTLDLSVNHNLIVNDLEWVSHLSSLRYLFLGYTNLSLAVDWQSSISKAPYLIEIELDSCGLPQVTPHSLLHTNSSNSLEDLSLVGNHLTQSTLSWVFNYSNVLQYLDLSDNFLQHIAPNAFTNMISLQRLYLSKNILQHISPNVVTNVTSLHTLDLSSNFLQYMDPKAFTSMTSLSYLNLQNNSLQHIAPYAFTNMTSLKYLDLSNNKLENNIVKSIFNLSQLQELDLSFNKLSDQLSHWTQQLCCAQNSIQTLDLSGNPFSNGPFPDLSRFSSLTKLQLENTNLHGPIPPLFGHLPYLSKLYLSYNNLSGPLPEFVGFLSLQALDLSDNQLTEILPHSLRQLPNLVALRLSSNKLNGVISETHLSTLHSIKVLDVSHNLISFNLSSNWIPPFQLQGFLATSCILGPNFPAWLKYQKALEFLDISGGGISDSIPEWFWNISSSMVYLNISHNKIHGALPILLPNIKKTLDNPYYVWDLSFNNLSGPLPKFSPHASALLLSNNRFSGPISSFCVMLQSISYLDLSNNLLSGALPDCWEPLQSLQVLNMAKNKFSGIIPNSIVTLKEIRSIHLNNNNLSGEMPSFMDSPRLQFIDVGQNNLNGKLPMLLGHNLPNLIGLHMGGNKFQGSIPTSICNLVRLQILDLSQNNIAGTIPHCLNNLIALSDITIPRKTISYLTGNTQAIFTKFITSVFIDNAILVWKGDAVEYEKNLGLMTMIDLSCNYLNGEIPNSITTLVALASLNLSRNNLIGFIPNNMGQMKMLESLDLSSNSLSGRIPESFSTSSFLSFLNLSFNNLSGKIPQTTQLQTFNASCYEGNKGLCGPPLTPVCPGDASNRTHSIDAEEDEDDELISFGFYISMIVGFIIGFWGVCGTLIFKRPWRRAYFQFLSTMNDWIYVQVVLFWARMKRRFQD